jgi:tRNA pseudouridine38-40 synthase
VRNVRLIVEYEGTDFVGWQRQKTGVAVQAVLEEALGRVTGETVRLIGAGRTDAGVHALGQAANFKTESRIPLRGIVAATNRLLPPTVVLRRADEVPLDFHAQYDAKAKRYRYAFLLSAERSTAEARRTYRVRGPLEVGQMRRAARLFLGTHDFSAFEASGGQRKGEAVRTVAAAEVLQVGPRVYLDVEADGFLYKMVRTMAGTLLEVGRGQRRVAEVRAALAGRERAAAGATAPARGLCLMWVRY